MVGRIIWPAVFYFQANFVVFVQNKFVILHLVILQVHFGKITVSKRIKEYIRSFENELISVK